VNNWKKKHGRYKTNKEEDPEYLVLKTETGISVSLSAVFKSADFLRSFTNTVKSESI
jgi:hypothetical protein